MSDPELWLQRIHPDDRAQVMSDEGEAKQIGPARQRVPLPARRRSHRVGARPGSVGRRRDRRRPASRASSPTSPSASRPSSSSRTRRSTIRSRASSTGASSRVSSSTSSTHGRSARAQCCSSTSTASSSSTTATATRPATRCCARPGGACRAALRDGDVLSRFGGDEFTAYLPNCDAGCRRDRGAPHAGDARRAVPGRARRGLRRRQRRHRADRRRLRDGDRSDPRRGRGDVRGQAGRTRPPGSSSTRACARPRRAASRWSARSTARSS